MINTLSATAFYFTLMEITTSHKLYSPFRKKKLHRQKSLVVNWLNRKYSAKMSIMYSSCFLIQNIFQTIRVYVGLFIYFMLFIKEVFLQSTKTIYFLFRKKFSFLAVESAVAWFSNQSCQSTVNSFSVSFNNISNCDHTEGDRLVSCVLAKNTFKVATLKTQEGWSKLSHRWSRTKRTTPRRLFEVIHHSPIKTCKSLNTCLLFFF